MKIMKKFLYAVAALALFAGCAKDVNETPVNPNGGKVTLKVTIAADTESRAIFDGDKHITWEAKDQLRGFVSKLEAGTSVGDSGTLTIVDEKAATPVFSGKFSIDEDKYAEEMWLFGLYPYSAGQNWKINAAEVKLAPTQTPTQEHWDSAADVMVIDPIKMTPTDVTKEKEYDYDGYIYYYDWRPSDLAFNFAHLFGFGKITFKGIPAECENEVVNKITITATGDSKNLSGVFKLDLSKRIDAEDFVLTDVTPDSTIAIAGDGVTTVKDFKAWFVANPGTYDVDIDVIAGEHKLHFERKGLVIERAKIAAPVVNYKDGDIVASTTVDLTGGKLWQHDAAVSYAANGGDKNFLKYKVETAVWGTSEGAEQVEYSLSYEKNEGASYAGSCSPSAAKVGDVYAQQLSLSNLRYGKVLLTSGNPYKGIDNIKVRAGIKSNNSYCNISAYIIANGVAHQIGETKTIVGNYDDANGTDFYFANTEKLSGRVQFVFWNPSDKDNSVSVYLRQLDLNPAPGITFGASALQIAGTANTGKTNVTIDCATGEPTVTTDVDWLTVSYANGVITYTAEENAGDNTRKGNIIVSATGTSTATAKLAVSQISSKLVEFKLTIKADDLQEALKKAADEYLAADASNTVNDSSVFSFELTLKAAAVDGSGLTKDVKLNIANILYETYGKEYIMLKNGWSNTGYIQNTESVGTIIKAASNNSSSNGASYLAIQLGTSASSLSSQTITKTKNVDNTYLWTCEAPVDNEWGFFNFKQGWGCEIYSLDVNFLALK